MIIKCLGYKKAPSTTSYLKIKGSMCCIVLIFVLGLCYERKEEMENKIPEHVFNSYFLKSIAMNFKTEMP